MKVVNLFYIALVLIALGLIWLFIPRQENEVAFFGFAENLETEINYNYAVMVEEIMVTPGEQISKGTPLIKLKRQKAKEELDKSSYQISRLQTEIEDWKSRQQAEKIELLIDLEEELAKIDNDIIEIQLEMDKERKLREQFYPGEAMISSELKEKLARLEEAKEKLKSDHDKKLEALDNRTETGLNTFRAEMDELSAEKSFEEAHKVISILVEAPQSGLVGNINCREGEHIPAFKTLMTFYEPHSSIVKGYVHEESILEIDDYATFEVSSLLKPEIRYKGTLIGMGSRIVEIPTRLRKFPQIKSYGREITIEIPIDNIFLQKEKVSVKLENGNE